MRIEEYNQNIKKFGEGYDYVSTDPCSEGSLAGPGCGITHPGPRQAPARPRHCSG